MKKILVMIVLISFWICLNGKTVTNTDKPAKGEWDFKLQKVWSLNEAGDDVLTQIQQIRVDSKGNIYLLDQQLTKFFVFSPDGKFLYSFGKPGEGPGELKRVFNFFMVEDHILVPDMGNIHYFSKDGKYIKSANPGQMIFPMAFVDLDRFLMVPLHMGGGKKKEDAIEIFNLNTNTSSKLVTIAPEKDLTFSGGGLRVRLKIPDTTPGIILGMNGENILYGKSDRYQITQIDQKGNEMFSFSLTGRERKKITDEAKRNRFKNISFNGGQMPADMINQMVKQIPNHSVYFRGINIGPDGNIYVYIADMSNTRTQEIDIFSPEGKYLYHTDIKLPDTLSINSSIAFGKDYLVVFAEDEEGERYLQKYKITLPPAQ